MHDLADYHWLLGEEAAGVLADLAASGEPAHRLASSLRKTFSAAQTHLLLEQMELRLRGRAKFGSLAEPMFFDEVALQQATDRWIAAYKAARFASGSPLCDYCCGIGGDLLALAHCGPTTAYDREPRLALFAEANLRAAGLTSSAKVVCANAEDHPPDASSAWHLDPDRRTEGRRSTRVERFSPPPELVDHWLATSRRAAIKLAPATNAPLHWAAAAELEWITRGRECRQQIAWFDATNCEHGRRRATLLLPHSPDGDQATVHSFVGEPGAPAEVVSQCKRFIMEVDPSLRAADLTGAFAAAESLGLLGARNNYLTGERACDHPLAHTFEVQDELPMRVPTLAKHLRALGVGRLEIKKRGVPADLVALEKQLKLRGDRSAVLLLTTIGKREVAFLAQRCESGVNAPAETG